MIAPRSLLMAVICALLMLSAGCNLQQLSAGKVLISDGCVIIIEGLSSLQANELSKAWDIDPNCKLKLKTEVD